MLRPALVPVHGVHAVSLGNRPRSVRGQAIIAPWVGGYPE